ncbi:hypothetical protein IKS86_02540 [bacterium]|nr:hypothetical protein [bacterium]
MNRIFTVILLIAAIVSLVYSGINMKKISSMEKEIATLKDEKIELMQEHEECLTYKEKSLRKELVTKYLDSIMLLLNNMEKGYEPTKEDTENFYERTDFIAKNINSVAVSKEETNLVMTFLDSAKKTFETKIKTAPEKDKD